MLRTLKNKYTKEHLCLFCAGISHLQLNKYLKTRKQIKATNKRFSFHSNAYRIVAVMHFMHFIPDLQACFRVPD